MSGQVGPPDHNPAGIIIYNSDNTKLELVGSGQGLVNKWKNAIKDSVTCVQVFEQGQYQSWRKEKGESGPALNIYNYAKAMVKTDFYWYDENTDSFQNGNTVPAGVDPDYIAFGVLSTDEYYLAVYNIAIEPARKPIGGGGVSEIAPGLLP